MFSVFSSVCSRKINGQLKIKLFFCKIFYRFKKKKQYFIIFFFSFLSCKLFFLKIIFNESNKPLHLELNSLISNSTKNKQLDSYNFYINGMCISFLRLKSNVSLYYGYILNFIIIFQFS